MLIGFAALMFICGLLFCVPLMRGYNPMIGLAICGGSVIVGILGYLLIKYRRPYVYLTAEEIRLPGYGIERIVWSDIVQAAVVVVHARGEVSYLGILLTSAGREYVKQPRLLKMIGVAANLMSSNLITGIKYDLMLNCDMLEWTSIMLAEAINSRIPIATSTDAR